MDFKDIRNLQEAYMEVYGELDEAEGSYGQTPKAHAAFNALYANRLNTGGNRKSVGDARKHAFRVNDPDKGHTGRKSPRPVEDGTVRRRMTQSDRDVGRQSKEYDPDDLYFGPQSDGPKGSLPRSAKKRQRQKMTGVSAESYNIYDILISHLLDEGYAETYEAAEKIMVNMSEEWRDDIVEKFVSPYEGKASYSNPQAHSPATRAMQKSDELQRTEPGSERQKKQTRRSQQLARMFQAARRA